MIDNAEIKSNAIDAVDDWSHINKALSALIALIAGCDQGNMPPPSMLSQLLALIEKESSASQQRLQAVTQVNTHH